MGIYMLNLKWIWVCSHFNQKKKETCWTCNWLPAKTKRAYSTQQNKTGGHILGISATQMDWHDQQEDGFNSINQINRINWIGTLQTVFRISASQNTGAINRTTKAKFPRKVWPLISFWSHLPLTSPGCWLLRPQNLRERTVLYELFSFTKSPRVSILLPSIQPGFLNHPVLSMNPLKYQPEMNGSNQCFWMLLRGH